MADVVESNVDVSRKENLVIRIRAGPESRLDISRQGNGSDAPGRILPWF